MQLLMFFEIVRHLCLCDPGLEHVRVSTRTRFSSTEIITFYAKINNENFVKLNCFCCFCLCLFMMNQINTGRTGYLGQIILPKSTLQVDQLTPLLVKLVFLLTRPIVCKCNELSQSIPRNNCRLKVVDDPPYLNTSLNYFSNKGEDWSTYFIFVHSKFSHNVPMY